MGIVSCSEVYNIPGSFSSPAEVHEGVSLVVVECRANQFVAPDTALVDYLKEKR